MPFESPTSPESPETLSIKALAIAQNMSHRWKELPKETADIWQAEDPDFGYVYSLASKEKTGIQRFFEFRFEDIKKEPDPNTKMEMLSRLVIELEKLQEKMNAIIRDY